MGIDLQALEEPITRILTAPSTDLATISAKRVRKALLEDPHYAFLGLTAEVLKAQRADVDQVIALIYDSVNRGVASREAAKRKRGEKEDQQDAQGNKDDEEVGGADTQPPTEPSEDTDTVTKAPKKKKKGRKTVEERDAALARKLSTAINSRSRRGACSTAGASNLKKGKRKLKKSAETVDSGEDGDEDGNGETAPEEQSGAKGGFAKKYMLSGPLSAVVGVEKLSRPQVVKKLWEYIRTHELQNSSNRREIICDDAFRAVFAVDKIDMFRMNKVLGKHLHEE